jgi:glutaredoxin
MEAKLRGLISNYDVSIFSLSYCPWCMRAKRLTDGMGPRSVVEVDLLMDRGNPMRTTVDAALRAIIKKDAGVDHRTYPKVFICGRFVGGFSDLDKFLQTNGNRPFHCRRAQKRR